MVAVKVSKASVRALTDEASFADGTRLLDQVEHLDVAGTSVQATVEGFDTDLTVTRSGLTGQCSRPAGTTFCKHCTATALHWI